MVTYICPLATSSAEKPLIPFGESSEVPEWYAGDSLAEGRAATTPSPRQFSSSSRIHPAVRSCSANVSKVKGLSDPFGQFGWQGGQRGEVCTKLCLLILQDPEGTFYRTRCSCQHLRPQTPRIGMLRHSGSLKSSLILKPSPAHGNGMHQKAGSPFKSVPSSHQTLVTLMWLHKRLNSQGVVK